MEEKKAHRFNFVIDPDLHHRIKLKAVANKLSLKEVTTRLLEEWVNDKSGSN